LPAASTNTVIGFVRQAIGRVDGGEGFRHAGVGGDEFFGRCRVGRAWASAAQGQQQIAKILARGDGKHMQGIRDDVGFAAVRQGELDGHAVRVCLGVAIRHGGQAAGIGKADGDGNRGALEQGGFAEFGGAGRGGKTALHHHALGVIGAHAGMRAPELVQRIHRLFGGGWLVGGVGRRGGGQSKAGEKGAARLSRVHAWLRDMARGQSAARMAGVQIHGAWRFDCAWGTRFLCRQCPG
jgi:hypothetical protein